MNEKLEKAIIRTFKKIREQPDLINSTVSRNKYNSGTEVSGLFVNFYYAETDSHGGLYTRDIAVYKNSNDIIVIEMNKQNYYEVISRELFRMLSEVSESKFYELWLRSSWEDPKEEQYGDLIARKIPTVDLTKVSEVWEAVLKLM